MNLNKVKLAESIIDKYYKVGYLAKHMDIVKLYGLLSQEEIDLIVTQDYPKNMSLGIIIYKLKKPIEDLEIDRILIGGL